MPADSSVADWLLALDAPEPMKQIGFERCDFKSSFMAELAKHLGVRTQRLYAIVGLPTAGNRKTVTGAPALATLGLLRLLKQVQEQLDDAGDVAIGFDGARWLGQWIEKPCRALGGRLPADLLDTPTGTKLVSRVIGAMQSGVYL
ncbi:hypothetical protein GCM10025770_38230 [Viridibacterium curvum]|uniref:Antitoxin Xre/MbcA/ParS-like toxin-binding domain-containing protein n=2 Tax=Viridibacterium curvum TaxID=1101404 RepID=A0ABP9R741_9RHOO